MNLDSGSVVVASKDQLASDIGGETVILGLTAGRYYGVDAVGARVWQLIQTPASVQDVARVLVSEYRVEYDRCEADVLQLLGRMVDAGLAQVQDVAAP